MMPIRSALVLFVCLGLFLSFAPAQAQPVLPSAVKPAQNAVGVPANTHIQITYPSTVSLGAITNHLFVRGDQTGRYPGQFLFAQGGGQVIVFFTPQSPFKPGERVTVTVRAHQRLAAFTYQFQVAAGTLGNGVLQKHDEHTVLASGVPGGSGENAIGLALGDVDGDGDLDAVVASHGGSGEVQIYPNQGGATFAAPNQLPLSGALDVVLLVLDPTNGPGYLDGAISRHDPGLGVDEVVPLLNDGAGNLSLGTSIPVPSGLRAQELTAADLDNDGDEDVVLSLRDQGGAGQEGFVVLRNDLAGGLVALAPVVPGDGSFVPAGLGAADLDNDWDLDLLLALTQNSGGVGVFPGNGTTNPGAVAAVVALIPGITAGVSSVDAIDLDPTPDGLPDLLVSYRDLGLAAPWRNVSAGGTFFFDLGGTSQLPLDFSLAPRHVRDARAGQMLAGSPSLDYVLGGWDSLVVSITPVLTVPSPIAEVYSLDPDPAVPAGYSSALRRPHDYDPHEIAEHPEALALGDLDGDGDLDVLLLADKIDASGMTPVASTHLQVYRNGNTGPSTILFKNVSASQGLGGHNYVAAGTPAALCPNADVEACGLATANNHGPGAAVADFDGDGWSDLYLPRETQSILDPAFNPADNEAQIYLGGPTGFSLVPGAAGAGAPNRLVAGAAAADYDNDGDTDIYVITASNQRSDVAPHQSSWHDQIKNVLYQNQQAQGSLSFVDVTAQTGAAPTQLGGKTCQNAGSAILENLCWNATPNYEAIMGDTMAASWADLNKDGLADLYVANFGNPYSMTLPLDQRDALYMQDGNGGFFLYDCPLAAPNQGRSVSGSLNPVIDDFAPALAAVAADFDHDGWTDVYVVNAGGQRQVLYRNLGLSSGSPCSSWPSGVPYVEFDAMEMAWDPMATIKSLSPAGMGIAVGDLDGDGRHDYYVTDTQGTPTVHDNDLFLQTTTSLVFQHYLTAAPVGFSWGAVVQDYDLDTDLDLMVSTAGSLPTAFFRNDGAPNLSDWSGQATSGETYDSRALASLDFDQDGWMDAIILHRTPPHLYPTNPIAPSLYRNLGGNDHHFIKVKLTGDHQNPFGSNGLLSTRDALGAEIRLFYSDQDAVPNQVREVIAFGSNAATTHELTQTFGLGDRSSVSRLEIRWPSGQVTVHSTVLIDQLNTIVEP